MSELEKHQHHRSGSLSGHSGVMVERNCSVNAFAILKHMEPCSSSEIIYISTSCHPFGALGNFGKAGRQIPIEYISISDTAWSGIRSVAEISVPAFFSSLERQKGYGRRRVGMASENDSRKSLRSGHKKSDWDTFLAKAWDSLKGRPG
ncbi:hypothetical protein ACOME3_003407 [Neoechinorhynchus agilis]